MSTPRSVWTGLLTLTLAAAAACGPETVRISPTPTAVATSAAPSTSSATPTRTATAAPTTAAPTPTSPATTSPGSTPPAACQTLTGGSPTASPQVASIRAAHNPGADRFVIEFTGAVVPSYEIKVANSFTAPSGQAVRVDGNAFFSVRVAGQAHTDAGQRSFSQQMPFRPGLPLIREIQLVEDFEGVVIFGVGLERLACPNVLTLLSPPRVVVDFPTPP